MQIERPHLKELLQRITEQRKFIQVITGPRQVGKTTLIHQLADKTAIPVHFAAADAVPVSNQAWLQQQWQTARIIMDQGSAPEYLLIIDEIQKIDNWSETVKLLWDEDSRENRNLKVILLGSSRLLLQQGLTESLAGRFESTYMGHWSFAEMREAFDWNSDQYIWFGGYPGSAHLINDEERWKAYIRESLIETSISKDILMLTRVDKPALMRQLFELGCQYSGQILSFNKILGQLQDAGNTTTLSNYLKLLDTAGLLAGLEKYSGKKIVSRSSSPKFQVHNTALISAQRTESFKDIRANPVQWGRMLESAIGSHLLNLSFASGYNLNYWREGNYEVDFVIDHKELTGIEVKSSVIGKPSGMEAFRKKFSPVKMLMVGEEALEWEL